MARTLEALLGREDAERIVEFRRDLHCHPEIGMDTARTAEKLEAFLSTFPVDRVERVEKNGVVALIKGREDGPMIGLRGDTDALPIQDETNNPWTSEVESKSARTSAATTAIRRGRSQQRSICLSTATLPGPWPSSSNREKKAGRAPTS